MDRKKKKKVKKKLRCSREFTILVYVPAPWLRVQLEKRHGVRKKPLWRYKSLEMGWKKKIKKTLAYGISKTHFRFLAIYGYLEIILPENLFPVNGRLCKALNIRIIIIENAAVIRLTRITVKPISDLQNRPVV